MWFAFHDIRINQRVHFCFHMFERARTRRCLKEWSVRWETPRQIRESIGRWWPKLDHPPTSRGNKMNLSMPQNGDSLPALLPRPYFILPILNAVNSGHYFHLTSPRPARFLLSPVTPTAVGRRRTEIDELLYIYVYVLYIYTYICAYIFFIHLFDVGKKGNCNNFEIFLCARCNFWRHSTVSFVTQRWVACKIGTSNV